jgi:replication factor A1
VAEEFLLRKDISFENWMDTDKIRRQRNRQNTLRFATNVEHLRHGMKKVNLEAEVLEASKPALVHTQWGNSATVTNVLIGDETGKIKLCLWNDQVDSVCVGDTIQVKNASVSTYKGERQLRLAKNGSIVLMPKMALTPSVSAKSKI